MDMPLPGIAWALAGLGVAAFALLAAPAQVALLLFRAPPGARMARVRAALAGPLAAIAIGVAGVLVVDQFDPLTRMTLDTGWFFLPLAALGTWFALNRRLIRALPEAGATSAPPPDVAPSAPRSKTRVVAKPP